MHDNHFTPNLYEYITFHTRCCSTQNSMKDECIQPPFFVKKMITTWMASWKKLFKAEQVTFIWLRLTATLILAMSNSNIYINSTMLIRSLYYTFHQNILPILDCWSCFPSTLLNSNKVLEDQNIHVITISWILLTTSKTSLKVLLCSLSGNTWGAGSWTPSTVQRISDGGFEASLWAEILIDLVPYDHHSIILALL